MREVALAEVLTLARDPVALMDSERYETVGIRSYGKGLFRRPAILGSETKYSTYYQLRAGQFVYSKLFAWEGALAVVAEGFDGLFVSQEFPTFDIDRSLVEPSYLQLLCQWPALWERVKVGESGMGGRRKRVQPDRLLEIHIPLPPLPDQRRVVDLLRQCDLSIDVHHRAASASGSLARALRYDHFSNLSAEGSVPARDIFDVTMGRQRSPRHAEGEHLLPYLRAANVKDGALELRDVKRMNFDPLEQMKYRLLPGDVLVTEGCGSLKQLGATARWMDEVPGPVCFQNTLIRLRGKQGVSSSAYAYQWARFAFETGQFAAVASGTNIFHIGAERLSRLRVSPVTLDHQADFTARVETADLVVDSVRASLAALCQLRDSLSSDLLLGRHTIPSEYDRHLELT